VPETTKAPRDGAFWEERATGIEPATSSLGSCDRTEGVDVDFVHVGRDGRGSDGDRRPPDALLTCLGSLDHSIIESRPLSAGLSC